MMEETTELFKEIKRIEIRTRLLSQQTFAGQYHSAFKGQGMAFSEVRQYQYGDDVRFIDWNVTARLHTPYVKVFEEERELTVVLMIDVSGSTLFGTQKQSKRRLITELAAVLAFSAIYNNDKVGVLFFSDHVEKFIAPAKGKNHILRIIRELLTFKPSEHQTNLTEALRFFSNAIKKKCTAFIISDFVSEDFEQSLRIAANRHDIIALNVLDKGEMQIPTLGLLEIEDPETGARFWADTSSRTTRKAYADWWQKLNVRNKEIFRKSGIDVAQLYTDQDYVPKLKELFCRRNH